MKYKAGAKVKTYIFGKKSHGTILECINSDEPTDVKIQGFRYYVTLGRTQQLCSVPEVWLKASH